MTLDSGLLFGTPCISDVFRATVGIIIKTNVLCTCVGGLHSLRLQTERDYTHFCDCVGDSDTVTKKHKR